MLIRLKVENFKNLVDVDVRFGAFTCVAGPNAAGKSNLFDAIRFLSALTDRTLLDAAMSVRGTGRSANVRDLFHRVGDEYASTMRFEAEMIVPAEGTDDLGQKAEATTTFLRYTIEIGYRREEGSLTGDSLELLEENLDYIKLGDASKHLLFPTSAEWKRSVLQGRRTSPFITTRDQDPRVIELRADGGTGGRPRRIQATNLPRTVLSTVNATENPTALLARREMQSWRVLQLEPSRLREPNSFMTPPGLQADGFGLAATVHHLAHAQENGLQEGLPPPCDQVARRLSELIDDVYAISVDRDERRELVEIQVTDGRGTVFPARSLSDGTLRFLALAVLEMDPTVTGVICLEEPENGIHPERIPAMLRLLEDLAVKLDEPVGIENPLRQVIVNTHSPAVVQQVPEHSLLVAELREQVRGDTRFRCPSFSSLVRTWRGQAPGSRQIKMGTLLSYLTPTIPSSELSVGDRGESATRRVVDRDDVRQLVMTFANPHE